MDEAEIVVIMREHFRSLFPQACGVCGHHYATLRQYILETERVPGTVSYDAELGEWKPQHPLGAVALANCTCGATLALSTEGIPRDRIHRVLEWIKAESERTGKTPRQLLEPIRDEVRAWALRATD